jgi:hypothetical protein
MVIADAALLCTGVDDVFWPVWLSFGKAASGDLYA